MRQNFHVATCPVYLAIYFFHDILEQLRLHKIQPNQFPIQKSLGLPLRISAPIPARPGSLHLCRDPLSGILSDPSVGSLFDQLAIGSGRHWSPLCACFGSRCYGARVTRLVVEEWEGERGQRGFDKVRKHVRCKLGFLR